MENWRWNERLCTFFARKTETRENKKNAWKISYDYHTLGRKPTKYDTWAKSIATPGPLGFCTSLRPFTHSPQQSALTNSLIQNLRRGRYLGATQAIPHADTPPHPPSDHCRRISGEDGRRQVQGEVHLALFALACASYQSWACACSAVSPAPGARWWGGVMRICDEHPKICRMKL
ncbi:hypothetical protein SEVIR_5G323451v4 [Setaria viridis]